ncbi:MAG: site-specific integrase [Christensenellaceae bacterium]
MKDLAKEFKFDCCMRELSKRTIDNYTKQIGYFINFLEQDCGIDEVERVQPMHIKQFINTYQRKGSFPAPPACSLCPYMPSVSAASSGCPLSNNTVYPSTLAI